LGEYTQEIPGDEDTPSSSIVKKLYGLRISSGEGTVMETNSEGELLLKKGLIVSASGVDDGSITIGQVNDTVINANNKFIVYNDGSVLANTGTFTGTINANEGTIGNLRLKEGNLISNKGQTFLIKITGSDDNERDALTISNGEMTVYGIINANDGGNIGGFKIENN
jgi:hypothetical protein